jgi:hypothetical protein
MGDQRNYTEEQRSFDDVEAECVLCHARLAKLRKANLGDADRNRNLDDQPYLLWLHS